MSNDNNNNNKLKQRAEDIMSSLLYNLSDELLTRLQDGTASSQDISNAIKLLHNNGITVEVKKGTPLEALSQELPFLGEGTGHFSPVVKDEQ